ncbi:hypothetical protein F4678DRAFT_479528 [Xylaria arbuscula]|nr:hypothetical protein F4678DRAFT_479528 [Xylaria arbuscula]
MSSDSRGTYWTSPSPCPHSYEEGVPVCWDCNEEGHVSSPSVATDMVDNGPSPNWQRLRRFRKSLGFWDMNLRRSSVYPFAAEASTQSSTQCSTLELRLPEEGLEVATPHSRRSQPGLIVVAGPRVVSPEEKFIKPEPIRWDSETKLIQSDDVAAPPLPPLPHDTPEPESESEERRIWGLRRRTFQIIIILTILAFLGVIIGIAVGVTQQKGAHSTSLSKQPVSEPVSSSSLSMPSMITETVSLYMTSHSSTFLTVLKTEIPSLSSHATKTTTITGTAGSRGDTDPETSIVAIVFVTQLPPSPTDTIRSQPTTTANSAPSPKTTSPVSSPSPAPIPSPTTVPLASPLESSNSPAESSPASNPADSPSSRICLGDDGSTYTDPSTGDKFRIECSVAHQGTDLENIEAYTMESCISLCTKNSHCKGAIWFNVGPQGTDLNYCWLKSAVGGPVQVNADAQSAVRL